MNSKVVVWGVTLLNGTFSAWFIGWLLDWIAQWISYYDMFAPAELARSSLTIGLPLAASLAMLGTWPGASAVAIINGRIWAVCCGAVACGLLVGMFAGLAAKFNWFAIDFAASPIVPAPRFWFCQGLIYATASCSLVGVCCIFLTELTHIRRCRVRKRDGAKEGCRHHCSP